MKFSVYLPMVVCGLIASASGPVSARLAPARAAMALALSAAAAALASTWGLVLLAATLIGETDLMTERAANRGVQLGEPVPEPVALLAAAGLAVAGWRLVRVVRSRRAAHRQLRDLCAAHGSRGCELVVVVMDRPHAVAVPGSLGRSGHILVSSGMLRLLDGEQRRALLAHERAHLRSRHTLTRLLVEVASALNPLLGSMRQVVAFMTERAADEHAAAEVGSRTALAQALSVAALWPSPVPSPSTTMAFHDLAVSQRVAALFEPALPERNRLTIALVLPGLTAVLLAAYATVAFVDLFDIVNLH